jgi:hypothetical protein
MLFDFAFNEKIPPFYLKMPALIKSGLETLHARRHAACVKPFNHADDPNHQLNELVSRPEFSLNS